MLVEAKSDVNAKDKEYDPPYGRACKCAAPANFRLMIYFRRFNPRVLAVARPRSISLLPEATWTLADCSCI